MRILKTSQFDHQSRHHGDDYEQHQGHGLDDMMIDDEQAEIHPHDDGAMVELSGEGHFGDDEEAGGEDLGSHLSDLIQGLQNEGEGENPEDMEVSMHLDAPNDLAGDLPADVDVDPDAFGEQDNFDDIGHEGSFSDEQPDEDFNDLSLDGELDGHLDMNETNGVMPDDEKEDLSGNHFETEGDYRDQDAMPGDDQELDDGDWGMSFVGHGEDEEESPIDIDSDFGGESFHHEHGGEGGSYDDEFDEGGHGGGGSWGSALGSPDDETGLGYTGLGGGVGHRGIYNHMNDDGGEVGEIDDIGDPSGTDHGQAQAQFGDGQDSHMDRSKPHKHPRDNFDDFIQ